MPFPPSINRYYGHRAAGRRVIKFVSAHGKDYQAAVQELLEPHISHCCKHFYHNTRLALHVTVYPPDRRKRDIDNILKALQDSLQYAKAFEDDAQIDDLHVIRDSRIENGKVTVVISVIKHIDDN